MKNHQNAPKKNHHEKHCVAAPHVEGVAVTTEAKSPEKSTNQKH